MSKAKDKIAEDEMFEKARIKVDEIRVRLKEYVATCTGEDRDFLVYRLKGEFDPHDELAIAYVAEKLVNKHVSGASKRLVYDDILQYSHEEYILPAITPDEYNSYLEQTGVTVNETILESVISREKQVQYVRNTRKMVYVPFSPSYEAFAEELRAARDEVSSWFTDRLLRRRRLRIRLFLEVPFYGMMLWGFLALLSRLGARRL
jgi:hypothetical protein